MSWIRAAARHIRILFSRRKIEQAVDEEIRFHLDMEAESRA